VDVDGDGIVELVAPSTIARAHAKAAVAG